MTGVARQLEYVPVGCVDNYHFHHFVANWRTFVDSEAAVLSVDDESEGIWIKPPRAESCDTLLDHSGYCSLEVVGRGGGVLTIPSPPPASVVDFLFSKLTGSDLSSEGGSLEPTTGACKIYRHGTTMILLYVCQSTSVQRF